MVFDILNQRQWSESWPRSDRTQPRHPKFINWKTKCDLPKGNVDFDNFRFQESQMPTPCFHSFSSKINLRRLPFVCKRLPLRVPRVGVLVSVLCLLMLVLGWTNKLCHHFGFAARRCLVDSSVIPLSVLCRQRAARRFPALLPVRAKTLVLWPGNTTATGSTGTDNSKTCTESFHINYEVVILLWSILSNPRIHLTMADKASITSGFSFGVQSMHKRNRCDSDRLISWRSGAKRNPVDSCSWWSCYKELNSYDIPR